MSNYSRHTIALLLSSLPEDSPSTEPCNEANPLLWKVWCRMKNRTDHTSPTIWTEYDVTCSAIIIISRHLRELQWDDQ